MIKHFIICVLMSVVLSAPVMAGNDKNLAIDLAIDHVDITAGFTGETITIFGIKRGKGDIVVTITGPARDTLVRRKENVFGIWMNRKSVTYKQIPFYYNYALSPDMSEENIAPHNVRIDDMSFNAEGDGFNEQERGLFQQGLIRNKQEKKLFPKVAQEIKMIDEGFFRTQFYIPSNVPTGDYTIRSFVVDDGEMKSERERVINVEHAGVSATIFNFAHEWAFIYGVLCVLFAMSVGWFANFIRRRLA